MLIRQHATIWETQTKTSIHSKGCCLNHPSLNCSEDTTYLLCLQACLLLPLPPNLIMSLQAAHLPQSGDWQTWKQRKSTVVFQRTHTHQTHVTVELVTHLTDTTALSFGRTTLFIILLYLIREEGIKDLVDQRGSGRFSWSLVLLDLCWVTNGLSSGSSPVNTIKFVFRGGGPFDLAQMPDMWSDGIMKPLAVNTPASGHATLETSK